MKTFIWILITFIASTLLIIAAYNTSITDEVEALYIFINRIPRLVGLVIICILIIPFALIKNTGLRFIGSEYIYKHELSIILLSSCLIAFSLIVEYFTFGFQPAIFFSIVCNWVFWTVLILAGFGGYCYITESKGSVKSTELQ